MLNNDVPPGTNWYYERARQKIGPLSYPQIASLTGKGGLNADTLVWRSGLPQWVPLAHTELADDLLNIATSSATPITTVSTAPSTPPLPGPREPEPAPAGVRGWSWGALLLSWVWAIRFRVWWGALAIVPLLGMGIAVWLGFKGRELAWQAGGWSDVATFNRVQRRWSIGGFAAVVLVGILGTAGYLHDNPAAWADLTGTASRGGGTSVKAEDLFDDMGKVLHLPPEQPNAADTAVPASAPPLPAEGIAPSTGASALGPQRTEIQGNTFQVRGGTLRVVGDDVSGRQLQLNDQPVPRVSEDELRMVAAYRYADRDTVLVTKACSGASCDWTWFLMVEVWPDGQVDVFSDDRLSITAAHAVPDLSAQPDGSLLITFKGEQGPEQWRYAPGRLSKQ